MKLLVPAVLATALSAAPLSAASISDLYSSFFVFGDSLSDDGKPGSDLPSGYFTNPLTGGDQYSNGRVFADVIDDAFGSGLPDGEGVIRSRNYAVGGARAVGGTEPDFSQQLGQFVTDIFDLGGDPFEGTPTIGDRPLVSALFGANDIFGAMFTLAEDLVAAIEAPLLEQPGLIVDAIDRSFATTRLAAETTAAGVAALAASEAFNDFLVYTLPDIGKAPAFNQIPVINELATLLTFDFNITLAEALGAIDPSENVMFIDIFTIFDDYIANPAQLGLANVTDQCFDNPVCTDPDSYLFWDLVHPTGAVHADFADTIISALTGMSGMPVATAMFDTRGDAMSAVLGLSGSSDLSQVPVPAALPMLLAAFGALGLVARRKRAA